LAARNLRSISRLTNNSEGGTIRFTVDFQDIAAARADVAVLKYAGRFGGPEQRVKQALVDGGLREEELTPAEGEHLLVDTRGLVGASRALFLGITPPVQFDYRSIREFAVRMMTVLKAETPECRHACLTVYGIGRGLDESECALALLRGFVLAIKRGSIPPLLERVSICEIGRKRVLRIQNRLSAYLNIAGFAVQTTEAGAWGYDILREDRTRKGWLARLEEENDAPKPHAFIAMPFREDLDDIYYYGIQNPVHASGLLCERADRKSFTGDVLNHIKSRIEGSSVVIAELSDASPNVYLEVGYAWGRGRPTILLTRESAALRFDVRNQRCLVYRRIKDLEEILARELSELRAQGRI
jgi:hypothetical protein